MGQRHLSGDFLHQNHGLDVENHLFMQIFA